MFARSVVVEEMPLKRETRAKKFWQIFANL